MSNSLQNRIAAILLPLFFIYVEYLITETYLIFCGVMIYVIAKIMIIVTGSLFSDSSPFKEAVFIGCAFVFFGSIAGEAREGILFFFGAGTGILIVGKFSTALWFHDQADNVRR